MQLRHAHGTRRVDALHNHVVQQRTGYLLLQAHTHRGQPRPRQALRALKSHPRHRSHPDLGRRHDTDGDGHSDKYELDREGDGYDPLIFNEQVDQSAYLKDFALGFVCGEFSMCQRSTFAWLSGNLAGGFVAIGDVRDAVAAAVQGRYVIATLTLAMVVPGFGDVLAVVVKVTEALRHLSASAQQAALRLLGRAGASGDEIVRPFGQCTPNWWTCSPLAASPRPP